MRKLKRLSFVRDDRGQAIVEAVLGMSLLSLAWILFTFSGFMAGNGVRCVSAARHMAWMKGNGLEPNQEAIAADFFGYTNEVTIAVAEREIDSDDPLDDSSDSGDDGGSGFSITSILAKIIIWAPPVWACEARYGIDNISEGTRYPYTLLNARLPFMREDALMTSWLKVEAHCEWERVNETWDDPGDVLEALWDGIMDTFGL